MGLCGMLKNERVTSIVRLVSFSALTAFLVSVGLFLPIMGFWGTLLCPLPLAVLGYREGLKWMAPGLFLTELILSFAPSLALYFVIGCFPLSLAVFLIARTRWTGSESLAVCVLASLGAKLALMAVFWALTGRNILFPDVRQVEVLLQSLSAGMPIDEAEAIREAVRQAVTLFPYMMPSVLLLYSMLDSVIDYSLCCHFLRGAMSKPPALPPLSNWRFPRSLLPAMILSFFLGWVWKTDTWLQGAMFASNLRLVLNVLFFTQGFSLALWWMERRAVKPMLKWPLIALMVFPLMWVWLILLGVSDMAFDFRARAKK